MTYIPSLTDCLRPQGGVVGGSLGILGGVTDAGMKAVGEKDAMFNAALDKLKPKELSLEIGMDPS